MSREYVWNYRVVIPQETVDRLAEESGWGSLEYQFDELDALTYAVEETMTPHYYGIGFGCSGRYPWAEYSFTANKTKARYFKQKLDQYLNTEAIEFSKVDDKWFKDHEDE